MCKENHIDNEINDKHDYCKVNYEPAMFAVQFIVFFKEK